MWSDGNLCNKYVRTPPTHYFLKSSERFACMEAHPYNDNRKIWVQDIIEHIFDAKECYGVWYIYMALCNSIYDGLY
jgi:hypothetical protein